MQILVPALQIHGLSAMRAHECPAHRMKTRGLLVVAFSCEGLKKTHMFAVNEIRGQFIHIDMPENQLQYCKIDRFSCIILSLFQVLGLSPSWKYDLRRGQAGQPIKTAIKEQALFLDDQKARVANAHSSFLSGPRLPESQDGTK